MSDVKTLRIKGKLKMEHRVVPFIKEIRAIRQNDAIEKVYDAFGSKCRLKRCHIKILSVEEIDPKTSKNPLIAKIASIGEEKEKVE
ncbi:MAG: 50S ribosomal protein L18Ae [Candidatus Bathyarchaeota archaeon]